ncbi:MAG: hypothetical protein B6U76_00965 [Desulfurococcales archaeon ex4484_217_2]|nr:MAG: hypothetical protein B6U76_00965 [Desulfurococcales archaeon ex4484_217_2]
MGRKVKCVVCGREVDEEEAVKPIINCTLGYYDVGTGICELTGRLCDYENDYLCPECAKKSNELVIYECIWADEEEEEECLEDEYDYLEDPPWESDLEYEVEYKPILEGDVDFSEEDEMW